MSEYVEMRKVYYTSWDEFERGWGCRSDGCLVTITLDMHNKYIDDYWKMMPKNVPDEYSTPREKPKEVFITKECFDLLFADNREIIRLYTDVLNKENNYIENVNKIKGLL